LAGENGMLLDGSPPAVAAAMLAGSMDVDRRADPV